MARIAIEERGGVQSDGSLYIANGDSICIDRIKVVPEESVPAAMITLCDYYWDGYFVGPAFSPDFSRKFYVYNQPAGRHSADANGAGTLYVRAPSSWSSI